MKDHPSTHTSTRTGGLVTCNMRCHAPMHIRSEGWLVTMIMHQIRNTAIIEYIG